MSNWEEHGSISAFHNKRDMATLNVGEFLRVMRENLMFDFLVNGLHMLNVFFSVIINVPRIDI